MSNIETLIKNAVDNAEITDYIVLVRGKCFTLILVEDFIKDITFGGQAVCDTLMNCWKSMGQFDGGTNPDNEDDDECDCSEDFVKIHFPKGEGIKVITSDAYEYVPDSVYIKPKGTDKYQQIVVDEEGNVRTPEFPDFPVVDYPVIDGEALIYSEQNTGVNFFSKLNNKKLQFLPLISPNIAIEYLLDDEDKPRAIQIKTPETGSSSSQSYYVDETYVPTPTSQPDGSRSKPYITLTDAINAVIGTGTRLNPQFPNGKSAVTLLSNVTDSVNPVVNNLTFRLENNVTYVYTGNNTYIFDTVPLYDLAKIPGGPLSQGIAFTISGEGIIRRQTGYGHVQNKNDDTYSGSSSLDPMSFLRIIAEGNGLTFIENLDDTGFSPLTKIDGSPLYNGATLVRGANIAPTIPMFNFIGNSKQYWGTEAAGTIVNIQTQTQVGIRLSSKASLYSRADKTIVGQSSVVLGYQTRDTSGDSVLYTPYPSRNLIEILDGSHALINTLSFFPDSPDFTKSNSFIRLSNESILNINEEIRPVYSIGAINFIEYSGSGNVIYLSNAFLNSVYNNFVKGDNVNDLELYFINSNINQVTNVFSNANNTKVNTSGTWSTIKLCVYNTGILVYPDNDSAKADLGVDSLYKTSTGQLFLTI